MDEGRDSFADHEKRMGRVKELLLKLTLDTLISELRIGEFCIGVLYGTPFNMQASCFLRFNVLN